MPKRAHDVMLAGLDPTVTVPCQERGVALPGNDVADDGLARHPHYIGQDFAELDVRKR